MIVAAAAYPLDAHDTWESYAQKTQSWVADAASKGAQLLLFPEYGRMELATLDGRETALDLQQSLRSVSDWTPKADALIEQLACDHKTTIAAPSGPVLDGDGLPVNRTTLFGPEGRIGRQDKQIMTRFERETWGVRPGGPLQVFDIGPVRVGVLICYDAEFPLLGRALVEAGAEILLVPSCTDTVAGYTRVRTGAMARALEGQCVVLQSPTVGAVDWSPAVDENRGAAGIFGPPDLGFPETGILTEGTLDAPGWVTAEVDPSAIARVRREGAVFNHTHWPESHERVRDLVGHRDLP